jgi:DNA-directed RNA polymerase subunit omega
LKFLDQKTPDEAIVVALGSNMAGEHGSPDQILEQAFEALSGNDVKILARSRLWRSRAWPDPTGPEYRNAVCLVETGLTPAALMGRLHEIELSFGRRRSGPNAPRTLDLDLIAYGRTLLRGGPTLPHPRAAERRFVMGPLSELLEDWRHPVTGRTAGELARDALVGRDAAPVA